MSRGPSIWRTLWQLGSLIPKAIVTGGAPLIYHPRPYTEDYTRWAKQVREFTYRDSDGHEQVALLHGASLPAERYWLLFGGNGSLAMEWIPIFGEAECEGRVLVCFEYPSYGFSKGNPSPKTIHDSADKLLEALAAKEGCGVDDFIPKVSVLGSSLGAAVAMETAARYGIETAILISPFTSMADMAARTVGPLFAKLLRHPFDNESALRRWAENRPENARVQIVHGMKDSLVPFSMGQKLADQHPEATRLIPVPEADHNDVLFHIAGDLTTALSGDGQLPERG